MVVLSVWQECSPTTPSHQTKGYLFNAHTNTDVTDRSADRSRRVNRPTANVCAPESTRRLATFVWATSCAWARTENATGVTTMLAVVPTLGVSGMLMITAGPPLDSQVDQVRQWAHSPVGQHACTRDATASTYGQATYGDAADITQVVATDRHPAWIAGHSAVLFHLATYPQVVKEERIDISASHFGGSRQGNDMASHNRGVSPEFIRLVADQHQQWRSVVRRLGVAFGKSPVRSQSLSGRRSRGSSKFRMAVMYSVLRKALA